MSFDHSKFSADLTESMAIARTAAESTPDDGTCNRDQAVIRLDKGVRVDLKKLPAGCFKHNWFGRCLFLPSGPGQANMRNKFAETLKREMGERGWQSSVYYQMD